jgi:hypothetical protein
MTSPETIETVRRHDRWSLWILAAGLLAVLLFWWCVVTNAFGPFLLLLFASPVIACGIVIMLLAQLVTRRFRAALSTLAAVAIMAGGVGLRGSILNLARYVEFAVHRAGYERAVEALRAKNPAAVPLRVILKDVDVSVFVVPTVFDYVVYDESDAIGSDPPVVSGNWLCAVPGDNDTMMVQAGGLAVRRLSDHFYFIEQTL